MAKSLLLLTGLILVFCSSCHGILHPTATAIPMRSKPSGPRKRHHNGHQPPEPSSFHQSYEDPQNWTPVISTTRSPLAGEKRAEFADESQENSEAPATSQLESDDELVSVFFVSPVTPLNSLQSSFFNSLMQNGHKSYTGGKVLAHGRDSLLQNSSQLQHSEKLAIPKKLAELFSKHAILAEASMAKLLHGQPLKSTEPHEAKGELPQKLEEENISDGLYDPVQMLANKRSAHIHSHPTNAYDEALEKQDVAESTYFPAEISLNSETETHFPHFSTNSVPFTSGNVVYLPMGMIQDNHGQHLHNVNSFHSLQNPEFLESDHFGRDIHRSEFDPSKNIFDTSDITDGNGRNSYRIFVPGMTPLESLFENRNPNQSPFPKHVLARIPGYVPPKGESNKTPRPTHQFPDTEINFHSNLPNQHRGFSDFTQEHNRHTDLALEIDRQSYQAKSMTIPQIPGYVAPTESPHFRQNSIGENNRQSHGFPEISHHNNLPDVNSFSSVPEHEDSLNYANRFNGNPAGQEHDSVNHFEVPPVIGHPTQIPLTSDPSHVRPSQLYTVPISEFGNQNVHNIGFTKNEAEHSPPFTLAQNFDVPSREYGSQTGGNGGPFHHQFNNLQNEFISFQPDTFHSQGNPSHVNNIGEHSDFHVNEPNHQNSGTGISSPTNDQYSPPDYDEPGHFIGNSHNPNLHSDRPVNTHVTHDQSYIPEPEFETPFQQVQFPSPVYGTPKRTYEPPSKEYVNIPQNLYNTPNAEYGTPQTSFGTPDSAHGNSLITPGPNGQDYRIFEEPSDHDFPQQTFVSHSQDFGTVNHQLPETHNHNQGGHNTVFESPNHGHDTLGETFNSGGVTDRVLGNFQSSHEQSHEVSHQANTLTIKDTSLHNENSFNSPQADSQVNQFHGNAHGSGNSVHHQNTNKHSDQRSFNTQDLSREHSSQSPCPQSQYDPDGDCIRGEGFKDYPKFEFVQETGFTCADKVPGLYADEEARCQVWHYCLKDGRKYSFICPIGTVFHQRVFTCDWWYNVDCSQTREFYHLNEKLYSD
ncbi:uncharacterized protein [Palaemon carinicauda]|uniref:uncharacterized protein n=1 Tax=Palaemon carinicauda TaxID=392227 RepID=UPI0035B5B215